MKELFKKYIKRECNEEEVKQIVTYFQNSEDLFDVPTIEAIHDMLEKYPDIEEKTANRIFNKILEVSKEESTPTKKMPSVWKYVAAAIVIGVLSTTYMFRDNIFGKSVKTAPIIVNNNIEAGTNKATLILEDGSEVVLEKGSIYQTQNANSNGEQIVYKAKNQDSAALVYNYLTIPRGGQFFVKLSDGTQVWLNSQSQLKYPVNFKKGETRKVELVYGEAYFDVSPSTEHNGSKFKVLNQAQIIEVLGTEFNIKAYNDEANIYTTLVEGSVSINTSTYSQTLEPSEQSILNIQSDNISVAPVNVYNEISWKDGIFSFRKKPLIEIMKVLSRWYDIDVDFANKDIEKVGFNGVLGKDQKIEDILKTIKDFGIIEGYEIIDKTIILK
ncbi:FecR family protein [Flavivirga aquimarina]|uniref:FecR family protein n=1 Tax=Flavivirga aquimarina TaxID=2027862 RepID=A0ABT8WGU1_9FLAO|nr:FecR family protein [Flavivirga aquimarina]MDO5972355.1 FecR family protein [Flavivirga aquimarina]